MLYGAVLLALTLPSCGGFRSIGGGGAWRSHQPTAADLEFAARTLGVRTVICLRAASPGEQWYDEEVAVCRRLGVEFLALGWSALGVADEDVDRLAEAFAVHPGPYLVHCRAGRDRTSLAAAVYRMVVLGHEPDAAGRELAFVPHGHLPILGFEAVDEAWRRFVDRNRATPAQRAGAAAGGSGSGDRR